MRVYSRTSKEAESEVRNLDNAGMIARAEKTWRWSDTRSDTRKVSSGGER